jgi:predicted aspartyl protease
MYKRCLALALALAAGTAAYAQTATTRLDAVSGVPEVDKTTQTEDVQFKNRDDRMTVPVRLSGAGPYQFLVDTGADRTAVSRDIVSKLKLQRAGGAELHTVSGISNVSTARIDDLQVTRRPESVDAAVLESSNMGADGIVGVDVLRSQRIQFDFDRQTMSIVPSETPDFAYEPGTIVVRARRKNGRLVVTDAVANGEHLTVVLDTGSQVSVGNQALRRRLVGNSLIDVDKSVVLESVTGEKIYGDYMMVREMTIGGIGLTNLAVVFTDAHTFKQLGLEGKPALLLGMNAIRAFKKVSIDFANRKFRVVLPEHSELQTEVASRGGR